MATKKAVVTDTIEIPRIEIERFVIPIVGDSSLIMHKW